MFSWQDKYSNLQLLYLLSSIMTFSNAGSAFKHDKKLSKSLLSSPSLLQLKKFFIKKLSKKGYSARQTFKSIKFFICFILFPRLLSALLISIWPQLYSLWGLIPSEPLAYLSKFKVSLWRPSKSLKLWFILSNSSIEKFQQL